MDHAVDYEDVVSYGSYVDDTGCRGRPPRRWTVPNRYARCRGQDVLLQRTLSRDPRAAESGFQWAPYGDPAIETLVVLKFRRGLANSNTELELRHLGLLHEQMRDDHEAIWDICLDRLEETL